MPIQTEQSSNSTCKICCEPSAVCSFSACSHTACKSYIAQWIERAETAGETKIPGCPFCRVEITESDICSVLGRSFTPTRSNSASEEELDELTQQWLQSQTGCGAHIEKRSGCNKMECICGYRFCYRCGEQNASCGCTPRGHSFVSNRPGRVIRFDSDSLCDSLELYGFHADGNGSESSERDSDDSFVIRCDPDSPRDPQGCPASYGSGNSDSDSKSDDSSLSTNSNPEHVPIAGSIEHLAL